jgi:hypothetical protein
MYKCGDRLMVSVSHTLKCATMKCPHNPSQIRPELSTNPSNFTRLFRPNSEKIIV